MHYEVEVTPDPASGLVFAPVRGDDGPIRYPTEAEAIRIATWFMGRARGIDGYHTRAVAIDGDKRWVVCMYGVVF